MKKPSTPAVTLSTQEPLQLRNPLQTIERSPEDCPLCFEGRGGKGNEYARVGGFRFLRCDKCSFTYKVGE